MTQQDKEDARLAVRAFLANRPRASFNASTMAALISGMRLTSDQVADAAAYWQGFGQVSGEATEAGATLYFQITTKGIQAHERGQ